MKSYSLSAIVGVMLAASSVTGLTNQTGYLNEPYLEWRIEWDGAQGNPYDVDAHAWFRHKESGEQKKSVMFYDGRGTWKFRFTGTRLGPWEIVTSGPGPLGGQRADVVIEPSPTPHKGFLTVDGTRWIWAGTGEPHMPQLVMSKDFSAYWTGQAVDTAKIDEEIREFITETGFTGFHKAGVGTTWFDINSDSGDTRTAGPEANPDPNAFAVVEAFLMRAYQAGASTHIWQWGADSYQVGWGGRSGPAGIGGPMSPVDQRLNRYIAARLGPIPGWSLGYGFDLEAWADAPELQAWYDFLKQHLGGWEHPIGGRADEKDTWDRRKDPDGDGHPGVVYRNEMQTGPREVFWTGGDYIGLYDYRVPYRWYVETLEFGDRLGKPVLQEDRFRIRQSKGWFVKDYTPELTRRGLWHSMMAGGVGNIWGNYLPRPDAGGSQPYDNRATGSIQNVTDFHVGVKDAIRAWHRFWFADERFRSDYRRANELTNDQLGPSIWDTSPSGGFISVALRAPDDSRFIFYRENANSIRMDLRRMKTRQPAVLVDTKTGERTHIGDLEPHLYESYSLPGVSDWTLTVGSAENRSAGRIQPYGENPYYWQYKGRPVMLLGGSKDDNLFQVPDLEEHLDLMQSVGANYIRNTMSDRKDQGSEVYAFAQLENGKYDLNQWNPEYWDRFERMLKLTAERRIFVQIEQWDQWDFNGGRWDQSPWNPDQNVNYSTSSTHLKGDGHYRHVNASLGQGRPLTPEQRRKHGARMDFFLTVPALQNDTEVLTCQQRFIDKVLSHTLRYDHVLYTVTNELFMQHSPAWSRYWAKYVKQKAAEAGADIEVTEMLHNHDLRHEQHRVVFDHPELFDFVDISQNSTGSQDTQEHWQNLQWVRDYISDHPRPINHTKTYGAADHSVPRFWRNIIGGAASCRFHRPRSGIGLNEDAQTHIKSMRMWLAEYDIFTGQPDGDASLLMHRDSDEAWCNYREGKQYSVYFEDGGEVTLRVPEGQWHVRWLDIERNRWQARTTVAAPAGIPLKTPGGGPWLGLVTRAEE